MDVSKMLSAVRRAHRTGFHSMPWTGLPFVSKYIVKSVEAWLLDLKSDDCI